MLLSTHLSSQLAKMHGLEKEEVSNDVCINVLGTFYRDSRMLLKNLSEFVEKTGTKRKRAKKHFRKLIPYEGNLGEEYFVGLVTLIFSRSIEEPSKTIKNLLNLIYEDEERHGNLLKKVAEKFRNKLVMAGPRGFEPRTTGLEGRRPILARRRARFLRVLIFFPAIF